MKVVVNHFRSLETDKGTGCTTVGMCGKSPIVSREQDLLMHALKGISQITSEAAKLGKTDAEVDAFSLDAAFATLTNVNFDEARFVGYLQDADKMIRRAQALYDSAGGKEILTGPAQWRLQSSTAIDMAAEAKAIGDIPSRTAEQGPDVVGMQELILYGLKGEMAYADHARKMGKESPEVYAEIRDSLAFLARDPSDINELVSEALKVGGTTLKVLELLSEAHTGRYGHPEPTTVPTQPRAGKAICVSGHDMPDLEALLEQTKGKGIDIYTHGEMLPGHGYPALKKHKHLYGNYGGAWQLQQMEFGLFKGPILMTSNCILEPRKSYRDRIYTTNAAGFPGVKHLKTNDFSAVIEQALSMDGFPEPKVPSTHTLTTGFGHNAVLAVADKVVAAVKSGDIGHFFLVGGCDGAEGERNYFKEIATSAPADSIILTLACGKFRFNKQQAEFGDIGGIPRLLDMGQCNDAYSAVQVAFALQKAFDLKSVNDLPLSFVVSWFEQKAVAVLLALLRLDIQNIRLGPKLPAFATPAIVEILQKNFQLKIIGDVKEDMKNMLANK